jgi:hypothetical protein
MPNTGFSRAGHTEFIGSNGAGACSLPSAQVGDTVVGIINVTTRGNESSSFETTISKAGQIQQTGSANLSGNQYYAFCVG